MESSNPALEQFLRSIPLFSLVEPPEMMDVLRLLRPVTLEPGEVLFKQGEAGEAMWILGTGAEVSVSATPPGGKRPVAVAYARAGETVGEMALVDDGARSGNAVVTQGGPAHHISAIDFHSLRQTYKPAAFKILRRICMDLCGRIRATNERIVPGRSTGPGGQTAVDSSTRARLEDIDSFEPFRTLPQVVKLALGQKLTVVESSGIQPIFAEGEVADAAYFVLSGEVTVGRGGRTLATMGPGQMFGLVAAIDGGTRSASCLTSGPAKLLRLSDADFDALFAAGNKIAFRIVDLVARQLVGHLREATIQLPAPGLAGQQKPLLSVASVAPLSSELEDAVIEYDASDDEDEEELLLSEPEILPLELELKLDLEGDEPF